MNADINKNKGFTLVELLISISLLAILSGVLFAILNPVGMQRKARDSQRVSDLAKIKVALESYFFDHRTYPISETWVRVDGSVDPMNDLQTENHIKSLPVDPRSSTGVVCSGGDTEKDWRGYVYRTDATGSQYVLATNTEIPLTTVSLCPVADICGATSPGVPCAGTSVYYTTADQLDDI